VSQLERWEEAAAAVKPMMEARHAAREAVLKQQRLVIQTASKCIKHIHRHQLPEAQKLLQECQLMAEDARSRASEHPEVLYAGYIQDAEKEMVEAAALLAIVEKRDLPTMAELGVGVTSWLNGMGEAASECRRYVLDQMRRGENEEAELMLGVMDGIYEELTGFDFPDSLTGGLRRTCDALRAVIERTRSDLTLTHVQQELISELRKAKG
jgi:translin